MPRATSGGAVTLEQVAQAAGVSLATASRALSGTARKVNPQYRDRVLLAAQQLNYSPNLAARSIAQGGTTTVALVVPDITDPYFAAIAGGVARAAEERGLIVTLAMTDRRPQRETAVVRVLRGQRPRSIIVVGSRSSAPGAEADLVAELTAYELNGGRVTFVSQPELPFRTVEIGNRAGAAALADRLLDLGYSSVAVLTGPDTLLTAGHRTAGFCARFAEQGYPIPARRLVAGEFTRDGGFLAASELHRRDLADVELVFAVNDVMAVGAMAYFRTVGIRLPHQLAVAGFDDISSLRDITPALTTVALPLAEIGRTAVELALDGEAPGPTTIGVEGSVIIRESTPGRH